LQVAYKLDLGEAATIILAEELNANRVLIDEKLGRKVAQYWVQLKKKHFRLIVSLVSFPGSTKSARCT
jgi:predicted nucleic acid-binding protein